MHLLINDKGELIAFRVTQGTLDDSVHGDKMTQRLTGKLMGDRGYIAHELFDKLYQRGLQLITKIKTKLKNTWMPFIDK